MSLLLTPRCSKLMALLSLVHHILHRPPFLFFSFFSFFFFTCWRWIRGSAASVALLLLFSRVPAASPPCPSWALASTGWWYCPVSAVFTAICPAGRGYADAVQMRPVPRSVWVHRGCRCFRPLRVCFYHRHPRPPWVSEIPMGSPVSATRLCCFSALAVPAVSRSVRGGAGWWYFPSSAGFTAVFPAARARLCWRCAPSRGSDIDPRLGGKSPCVTSGRVSAAGWPHTATASGPFYWAWIIGLEFRL